MAAEIIQVGADPFPPYQYLDENGEVVGQDYTTVKALFAAAGFEIHMVIDAWDTVFRSFEAGELEALFQVQKSPERESKYYFSQLLRNAVTEFVTGDEDLQINRLDEISKRQISLGVLTGYTYGEAIDSLPESCKRNFDSTEEMLISLTSGDVDLGIVDKGVKEYLLGKLSIDGVRSLDDLSFKRPLYIMFRDKELCERVSTCQGM